MCNSKRGELTIRSWELKGLTHFSSTQHNHNSQWKNTYKNEKKIEIGKLALNALKIKFEFLALPQGHV